MVVVGQGESRKKSLAAVRDSLFFGYKTLKLYVARYECVCVCVLEDADFVCVEGFWNLLGAVCV